MLAYSVRRLSLMVPTLAAVSVITFFGLNAIPGDIALIYLGADDVQEDYETQIEAFRERHGLNQPVGIRYLKWVGGILTGDAGDSMRNGLPVFNDIKARFPVTLQITILMITFTAVFGIVPGILAAVYQDRWTDHLVRVFAVFSDSFPNFFLLTMLLLLPAIFWRYGPPVGYEGPIWTDPVRWIRQFVPPTLVVGLGAAFLVRITRSSLLEVLRADYIRTARAKGVAEEVVILRHAMRNALIPVVTILGTAFAALINGTIILENVMGLPGLGQYTLQAVEHRDFNAVQAVTVYTAVAVMVVNLIVDLSYAYLNPRIRYS